MEFGCKAKVFDFPWLNFHSESGDNLGQRAKNKMSASEVNINAEMKDDIRDRS